jgi:predicted nucleotidyltransferase
VEAPLKSALQQAVHTLEEHKYRYAVIGGVALAQWGVARYTYDVDLKVLVPNLDFDGVRANLRSAFPIRARAHVPENPYIVAVSIDGVIVDFLLTLPGYEEQIIERAVQRDLGGWTTWICSAEDLIIQKASAGRGKDWPDIEALLIEQYGKLDYAYIEDWLQQFAEALENPELLREYHSLRDRVESLR